MPRLGAEKRRGRTPTTVYGTPSSSSGVPITSGSDPKRSLQAWKLSTTTRCAPATASSSVKNRPRCGATPYTPLKNDGDTSQPRRACDPEGPLQVNRLGEP